MCFKPLIASVMFNIHSWSFNTTVCYKPKTHQPITNKQKLIKAS